MHRVVAFGLVGVFVAVAAFGAAPEAKPPAPAKEDQAVERLEAWAEHVLYNAESGKFTFTGNVTLIKGDMRVDCREMEGIVDPKTRQFTRMIAVGDVSMATVDPGKVTAGSERPVQPSSAPDAWRATCQHADYDLREGKVIMKGAEGKPRPRLARANGLVEANVITFYPDKGNYEFEGSPVIQGEIVPGPPKSSKPKEGTPRAKEGPAKASEGPAKPKEDAPKVPAKP
jgi:lipopolysaccharide export system protein LptA